MRIKLQSLAITISWLLLSAFHLDAQVTAEMPPQLKLYVETGHTSFIHSIALSSDGKILASASEDNTVKLWDAGAGKEISTLTGHSSIVSSVVFSPNGKILATADYDGVIRLWNLADSRQELKTLTEHLDAVSSIAFSPNGKTLVSGSWDNSIKLWDVATGRELKTFTSPSPIDAVAFSPDGKMISSGSRDKLVKLWDVNNGLRIASFTGHSNHVTAVTFSPKGNILASASLDQTIKLWNIRTKRQVKTLAGHRNAVETIAFSKTGNRLISGSWDNDIKLWNVVSGSEIKTFSGHTSIVSSVVFSPNGKIVISGSFDKSIKLWEIISGRELKTIKGHTNFVLSARASSDNKIVAIANTDKSIKLWEINSRRDLKTFATDALVRSLAFSPDDKILASGGDENAIKLWNTATGELLKTLPGHNSEVLSLAFSPDGAILASGSTDKTIKLWNAADGHEIKTLFGNTSYVNSLAFSPNGKMLVSGCVDNQAKLWNLDSKEEIKSFDLNNPNAISEISRTAPDFYRVISNITPDGSFRIAEGENGKLDIYELQTGKLLVSLVVLDEKDWVAVTPDGRFDTNKSLENIDGLHWTTPNAQLSAFPLEIFMRDYFEPKLLSRFLKCTETGDCNNEFEPVRDISSINRTQPKIRITRILPTAAGKGVEVSVEVSNVASKSPKDKQDNYLSSGVFDLRLFRNGQLVGHSTSDKKLETTFRTYKTLDDEFKAWREANAVKLVNGKTTFKFKVKLPNALIDNKVEFSAYAFNDSRVKSETARETFITSPGSTRVPRKAYVITFGVNKFDNSQWDLRFAANDARATREIVSTSLHNLKEFADVIEISLISDDETNDKEITEKRDATKHNVQTILQLLAGKPPSGERLKSLEKSIGAGNLRAIQAARPDDFVLLSFSSHGYADRNGIFYILPSDIGKDQNKKVTDELLRRSISSDELSLWLRDVDAGELVMIVDACHAASAVEGKNFKPAPMGSRGLGQLAFDKGMKILTATQAADIAIETGGTIRHGLLTYSLVREGIEKSGADFRAKDKVINLKEWLEFGEYRVPGLYEDLSNNKLKSVGKDVEEIDLSGNDKNRVYLQTPTLFDFTKKPREMILTRVP